jgi:hypothetical protein
MEHLGAQFFRAVRQAIGRILRAALAGIVLGGAAGEAAGFFLNGGTWPPSTFVHVAAGAMAIILGYALAVTAALVQGVRGMVAAASHVDDVARAAGDAGLNVVDTLVDAVDGPNRHGIR